MRNLILDSIWTDVPYVIALKVRNEGSTTIVMSADGMIDFLNETATYIFKRFNGKNTVGDIFNLFVKEYAVEPDSFADDYLDLLRSMQWNGFIQISNKQNIIENDKP